MYRRVGGFWRSYRRPEPRLVGRPDATTRRRPEMRAAKMLAVLAIAALGIGLFSAVALAGKTKKKTAVVFHTGSPTVSKSGQVAAVGTLHTTDTALPNVEACE